MILPIYKYSGLRDLLASYGKVEGALKKDDLCVLLDIHANTMSNWLKIKSDSDQIIKDSYLEKIASYFEVDTKYLISETYYAPSSCLTISTKRNKKK